MGEGDSCALGVYRWQRVPEEDRSGRFWRWENHFGTRTRPYSNQHTDCYPCSPRGLQTKFNLQPCCNKAIAITFDKSMSTTFGFEIWVRGHARLNTYFTKWSQPVHCVLHLELWAAPLSIFPLLYAFLLAYLLAFSLILSVAPIAYCATTYSKLTDPQWWSWWELRSSGLLRSE